MKHKCQEQNWCSCSSIALEPDDNCPLHGYPWPPRCEICGRFMKWPMRERTELEDEAVNEFVKSKSKVIFSRTLE